jgi:hypothetical protein
MNMKTGIARILILCVALGPAAVLAQHNTDNPEPFFKGNDKKDKKEEANMRTLQGVVKDDADNLIEGAIVQLKNKKTDQIRSFITLADGAFFFNGLSNTIDYEVKANSKGRVSPTKLVSVFETRKKVVVALKVEKVEKKESK